MIAPEKVFEAAIRKESENYKFRSDDSTLLCCFLFAVCRIMIIFLKS